MDIKKILFKTNSIDVEKALPDAIVMCNKEGKILWVNDVAAEIFETSKMHLLTSNISDFLENSMNLISSSIILHKPVITKLLSKEVYFDMTVKEIEEGFVLDLRDSIFENKHLSNNETDDNESINKNKNNFLLKLSNDLKAPIQSIVGFSQAMADGLGGQLSEQQEKYIKIINKNSTELMYFIAKLLELSQTEQENNILDKKLLDIINLVNNTIRFNEQLYKGKDVKISLVQNDNLQKMISTDENFVKMIIQNILEVILKSVEVGEIIIEISTPEQDEINSKNLILGEYTKISISSSSFLLSENDLECIFDPYKILDSSNRKNILRAIVLASVKNVIQKLNGIIWVESQILKNTSFNIIIPSK